MYIHLKVLLHPLTWTWSTWSSMTMKKTALVLFRSPSSKFLFTLLFVFLRNLQNTCKSIWTTWDTFGYCHYIHSISHENPTPIISHYTWWLYHISYIPLKSCYISWSYRSKLEFLGNPLRHRIQLPHLHLLREAAHGDDFWIQDRFPRWQFLET